MKTCLLCEGISDTDLERCSECGLDLVRTTEAHFPVRRGEEDAANPMLGAVIDGKYRITHVLGKGGMGAVFGAVHQVSLVPVALKVLHPRLAARPEHRRSFVEEARKAARVDHEHSARILDVGEDADGTTYIAMELVEGVTLAEVVRSGALDAEMLIEILHQICRALVAAHATGVVHRDLSPRNVMVVVRDGRPFVKILDFGIAMVAGRQDGGAPLAAFANPPYSAPEHLEGGDVDGRADLYSLGVIVYEALTGELPVRGATTRELARATVESRVRPLRAPAGTPKRLVRLAHAMLARDRARRPATAAVVLRELDRLRTPRGRVLKPVAVALLFASLLGFVVVGGEASPRFLQLADAGRLHLHETVPSLDDTQYLRSEDLDDLRFSFGGFAPHRLVVKAGEEEHGIEPLVDGQELTLSRAHSPSWRELVAALSRSRDPVTVTFQVPGWPALGFARVRIDDSPPRVELTPPERRSLGRGSHLVVAVEDTGVLERLELVARIAGEERIVRSWSDPSQGPRNVLAEELGALQTSAAPTGPLALRARAVDLAGNLGRSQVVELDGLDVSVPEVREVGGVQDPRVVIWGQHSGARVKVALSAMEPGLVLQVEGPLGSADGRTLELPLEDGDKPTHVVDLMEAAGGRTGSFVSGIYEFRVVDRAGNISPTYNVQLRFASEDVDARLSVESGSSAGGRATVVDEATVLTDGSEVELRFECSAVYGVKRAGVSARDGVRRQEIEVAGCAAEQGRSAALLRVPALGDGEWQLSVHVVDTDGVPIGEETFDVYACSEPFTLRMPDAGNARFLEQLRDANVLAGSGDQFWPHRDWVWQPPYKHLVRGRLRWGRPEALDSEPWSPAEAGTPQLTAQQGENVLAVDLVDFLQRPVRVVRGREPAPVLEANGSWQVVATFFHASRGPSQVGEAEVEYGQPVKVDVRAPLPFRSEDRLTLSVLSIGHPVVVTPAEEGCRLRVTLPFAEVEEATGFVDLPPEDYARARQARASGTLSTPAGKYTLPLTFRSTRSALRPRSLGDFAERPEVPQELAGIRMVPVLAPPRGVHRDPVAEDVPLREQFRVGEGTLDVEGVEDFFLQTGELTRGQYAALARAAAGLAGDDVATRLVHDADPLGADRLHHMLPTAWSDLKWAEAMRAPERAVTGVDFFQAYTAARVAGHVLRGDPAFLRLPTGVELEVAALGQAEPGRMAWNAAGRTGEPPLTWPTYEKLLSLRNYMSNPAEWPLKVSEAPSIGDEVPGELGGKLVGLDFGVREWVFDLPWLPMATATAGETLRGWLWDHSTHLRWAQALADGQKVPEALASELSLRGAVRGLASGEQRELLRFGGGTAAARGPVPRTVPGVTRTVVLRRDGSAGLLGPIDRRLHLVGFRLAGGTTFVAEART